MRFTTEDAIETYNLELLDGLGYRYTHGAAIAPDDAISDGEGFRSKDTSSGSYLSVERRQSFSDVLLKDRLTQAIARINPHIPPDIRQQAQRDLQNIASSPDLIHNNETFHRYLTEGITVEYQRNGETKGEQLWLIDWTNPDNNEFLAVNQFTIIEDNHNRRPDIILFINGLPLVVIELKNAADAKADLQAAWNQLQTYKREIPSITPCWLSPMASPPVQVPSQRPTAALANGNGNSPMAKLTITPIKTSSKFLPKGC